MGVGVDESWQDCLACSVNDSKRLIHRFEIRSFAHCHDCVTLDYQGSIVDDFTRGASCDNGGIFDQDIHAFSIYSRCD
jgi:hypothetical protein